MVLTVPDVVQCNVNELYSSYCPVYELRKETTALFEKIMGDDVRIVFNSCAASNKLGLHLSLAERGSEGTLAGSAVLSPPTTRLKVQLRDDCCSETLFDACMYLELKTPSSRCSR